MRSPPEIMASWILRKGGPRSGFRYIRPDGRTVNASERERIEALRIPPAWTDVHVAANRAAPIQAWGFDAKGRKQYRYHVRSTERASLRKHYRVRELGTDLARIRELIDRDFRGRLLTRDRVAAGVVRLIIEKFFRVGSERYARENGTFGIATLRKKHVRIDGPMITFSYPGKRSIAQRQVVHDPSLARFVTELVATPGPRLFRYRNDSGWSDLTARDVNAYLRRGVGVAYTAKDFRTWGGTLRAATVLAELGPASNETQAKRNIALAIRLVAAELGNTPAICRKSYVHPIVIARYLEDGTTIRLPARRAAPGRRIAHRSAEEHALLRFLAEHFPERRQKARGAEKTASAA